MNTFGLGVSGAGVIRVASLLTTKVSVKHPKITVPVTVTN